MVSKRKKKYTTGEGAQFLTRKAALKKLQLSLKDFRRLCIIKGIYPREPRNRKRAQQGSTQIKTLYHKKDIQFLMHEPIIWKLRDYKIFNRKVGRAKAIRDFESMKRYLDNHPSLKLDHIVKERYPTFIDALRDLDDCLTLCFLFSTFPSLSHIPREQSDLCRRLTTEFLHFIIEAKALRKVFISIKGYYFQAEIKGQTITWIVPHHFSFQPQTKDDVDFRIMSTFVEFYTVMLGFINFRLYHSLNLIYPPNFSGIIGPSDTEKSLIDESAFVSERIASLNFPVSRSSAETNDEDIQIDSFETDDDLQKLEEKKLEQEKIKQLKTMFKGFKFFVNREVPREPLVFMIRCFGGEISWDKTYFLGATFDETDETITHQIVDRPQIDKQYISRYYVQPQWVFDSVNARELLPVNKYLIGAVLPPHLSPFVDPNREQEYIPPEEMALRDPALIERLNDEDEESDDDVVDDDEEEEEDEDGDDKNDDEAEQNDEEEQSDHTDTEDDEEDETNPNKETKMKVTPGTIFKEVPWEKNRTERQEMKLREKMIKKKHKNLYKSMMEGRKDRAKEIWLLRKKRRLLEEKNKVNKSQNKKAANQTQKQTKKQK